MCRTLTSPASKECGEYIETGDPEGYQADPDHWCGWQDFSLLCDPWALQAFYVTAGRDGEPESVPSETVLWDCAEDPGYARLETQEEFGEALVRADTQGDPTESSGDRRRALGELSEPDAEDHHQLLTAPMLQLGQSGSDIPFAVYDIHVDHLGSTRVVTGRRWRYRCFPQLLPVR